jgi:hypothetical protein
VKPVVPLAALASIQCAYGLLAIAIVTGCTGSPSAPRKAASHPVASHASAPAPPMVTGADVRQCPKTLPSHYPHEAMVRSRSVPRYMTYPTTPIRAVIVHHSTPGSFSYGNGKLWTILTLPGVLVASGDMVRPNGSISWKFPFWRMVAGQLSITGRRLDAPAPPLTSRVPNGYGTIGFQASGVIFPTEGCWQVTAKTMHTSLTFVAFVITKAHNSEIFGRHQTSAR